MIAKTFTPESGVKPFAIMGAGRRYGAGSTLTCGMVAGES